MDDFKKHPMVLYLGSHLLWCICMSLLPSVLSLLVGNSRCHNLIFNIHVEFYCCYFCQFCHARITWVTGKNKTLVYLIFLLTAAVVDHSLTQEDKIRCPCCYQHAMTINSGYMLLVNSNQLCYFKQLVANVPLKSGRTLAFERTT